MAEPISVRLDDETHSRLRELAGTENTIASVLRTAIAAHLGTPLPPPSPPSASEAAARAALAIAAAERGILPQFLRGFVDQVAGDAALGEDGGLLVAGVPAADALDHLIPSSYLPGKGSGGSGGGAPLRAGGARRPVDESIPAELGSQAAYERSKRALGGDAHAVMALVAQKGGR